MHRWTAWFFNCYPYALPHIICVNADHLGEVMRPHRSHMVKPQLLIQRSFH